MTYFFPIEDNKRNKIHNMFHGCMVGQQLLIDPALLLNNYGSKYLLHDGSWHALFLTSYLVPAGVAIPDTTNIVWYPMRKMYIIPPFNLVDYFIQKAFSRKIMHDIYVGAVHNKMPIALLSAIIDFFLHYHPKIIKRINRNDEYFLREAINHFKGSQKAYIYYQSSLSSYFPPLVNNFIHSLFAPKADVHILLGEFVPYRNRLNNLVKKGGLHTQNSLVDSTVTCNIRCSKATWALTSLILDHFNAQKLFNETPYDPKAIFLAYVYKKFC
jgi:hypothetical protein